MVASPVVLAAVVDASERELANAPEGDHPEVAATLLEDHPVAGRSEGDRPEVASVAHERQREER